MKIKQILPIAILLASCSYPDQARKYPREPLPADLEITVIQDNSNKVADKNQLTVELNKKATVGQIATISDSLYKTKKQQGRFYIFYTLPGMNPNAGSWTSAIYNPDLDIVMDIKQPDGLTKEQKDIADKNNKKFEALSESIENDSTLNK